MERIYFDNASTTPIDPAVKSAILESMDAKYGNPSSIHYHGRNARSLVEQARKEVAQIIEAKVSEVFFTSSATEANNTIIKQCVEHFGVERIISSPLEHHCVLHSLDYLEATEKAEVVYLSVDKQGHLDYDQLQRLLREDQKTLVTLMHANNEIGTINDVDRIGKLCQETGTLFHSDTVQTLGKYPISVSKSYFSFISGSAHKFHGPKGVGFFYMNSDNLIPPYIHGGAQERNMRAGTENIYGIVGLAAALKEMVASMQTNHDQILSLKQHFQNRLLTELEDIQFNGAEDEAKCLYNLLSVSFPATDRADMLMFNLDISGISASSGSACSSGIEEDSHVLIATGHPTERKTIRFSFSKYNSIEEVDTVMEKLKTMTPAKMIDV